ncbi:MAG: YbaB/EbfC family nucleoid-associated protein [Alphaproteobacteria bacterium]|nr:YbaB/EbfC family nucleoid-associated protein [Alphaproteobacteria bacterium]
MNIMQIMQQAKVMQTKMAEMQERMGEERVTGSAGNGAVQVVMTCKGRVDSVKIDPRFMDPKDPELLEDLVKAAVNEARKKGDDAMAAETKKMMEDMGLPANAKLPF